MSKKIKRALAASLGLMTPATFAHGNIISNSLSSEVEVESSSDRIFSLCEENPDLQSLLTTEIFNKKGNKTGKITLEPLCEKHRDAYSFIFDIKEPNKKNTAHNSYYKYFTSKDEITTDKGKRYYEKHIRRINGEDRSKQNIFFTILYSPFDEAPGTYGAPSYVASMGISRCFGDAYLEAVVNPGYSGKGIASNALKCMINFLNKYNFVCDDDEVTKIEAIIATENFGSIGMAKKNSFINVGHVTDLNESNGHVSDRWKLKLHTDPVLNWARQNLKQLLVLPFNNLFPESQVIRFNEFFAHPKHFSRCKNHYKKIAQQVANDMNSIVDKRNVDSLKKELSSWPIAWISEDGKNMEIAINLRKLPETINSLREWNSICKNAKAKVNFPNIDFKK